MVVVLKGRKSPSYLKKQYATLAELADARHLKCLARKSVPVQVREVARVVFTLAVPGKDLKH